MRTVLKTVCGIAATLIVVSATGAAGQTRTPTKDDPIRYRAFAVQLQGGRSGQVDIAIERWTTESEREKLIGLAMKAKEGEPQTVITHPIGIGKVGWQTPEGTTKVTGKRTNPTWFPPASVRKEHKEAGDPLPSKVPPGPDNPLGAYMMTLGWPSYLIHGTNKPYGVGLRSSHGCMRFYPEDIAELYGKIPVGTKVTVVNQPFVFGWHDGALYVQAFPVMEDDEREHPKAADALLNAAISDEMWQKVKYHGTAIDLLRACNVLPARHASLPGLSGRGFVVSCVDATRAPANWPLR